jgi:hypothetical protein
MPVGVMLRSMTGQELDMWSSLFKVKALEAEMKKAKSGRRR